MSGGSPPTKTFLEYRSVWSVPADEKNTISTTEEKFAGYNLKLLCEVKSASKLSASLPVKKGDLPLLRGKFRFLRCFLSSGDMFW